MVIEKNKTTDILLSKIMLVSRRKSKSKILANADIIDNEFIRVCWVPVRCVQLNDHNNR